MKSIPFVDLAAQQARIRGRIDARIRAVLDHGQYIMGPEVAELEKQLAAFAGARHVISMASGTDALLAALMAAGVGPGDAVFTPAFTFPATAEVVVMTGAEPVFVDVEAATANLDPADLARRIDTVKRAGRLRPRAVMPVDLYGLPADYEAIAKIAAAHNLMVIADAAQSFGGAVGARKVGALAAQTCISFFPAKPLGGYGDGGAVLTDDDQLAATLRSIREHGKGGEKYEIQRIGLNARLDTLQAAILLAKMEIFADEIQARDQVANWYEEILRGAVQTPPRPPGTTCAWAQYTIQVEKRETVASALKARGIPTAVYYPKPMHAQRPYARYAEGPLLVSERFAARVLSLPMHPYLGREEATRIATAVREAVA